MIYSIFTEEEWMKDVACDVVKCENLVVGLILASNRFKNSKNFHDLEKELLNISEKLPELDDQMRPNKDVLFRFLASQMNQIMVFTRLNPNVDRILPEVSKIKELAKTMSQVELRSLGWC
jgi:hypothetical protein